MERVSAIRWPRKEISARRLVERFHGAPRRRGASVFEARFQGEATRPKESIRQEPLHARADLDLPSDAASGIATSPSDARRMLAQSVVTR